MTPLVVRPFHRDAAASALGLSAIHAIIREGNTSGLSYYSAIGFEDIEQTVPGRVRKIFQL